MVFFGSIVNIKNEYLFSRFIGVNLSAEQTNCPKNANWDVEQKISKIGDAFIPNEPRKRHPFIHESRSKQSMWQRSNVSYATIRR